MRVVPTVRTRGVGVDGFKRGFRAGQTGAAHRRAPFRNGSLRARESPEGSPAKDSNVRNVQKCFRTSGMPPVARCRKDSIF